MLTQAYNEGARTARRKLALAPPTQADEFVANVESGKDVPLDPSTDVPPDPLAAPAGVSEGIKAALAKFAVSSALVGRAAASTAARNGGMFGPAMAKAVAGGNPQGRALYNPRLQADMPMIRSQARSAGGTLPHSAEQQGINKMMQNVPHGSMGLGHELGTPEYTAANMRQRGAYESMLGMTGRTHTAPGANKQILESFGPAKPLREVTPSSVDSTRQEPRRPPATAPIGTAPTMLARSVR